jgi:hypothetical protein
MGKFDRRAWEAKVLVRFVGSGELGDHFIVGSTTDPDLAYRVTVGVGDGTCTCQGAQDFKKPWCVHRRAAWEWQFEQRAIEAHLGVPA